MAKDRNGVHPGFVCRGCIELRADIARVEQKADKD